MVSEVPGSNPGWGRCFFFFCFPFLFGGFCSLAGLEDGLKRPLNMSDLHTMTLYIMVELIISSEPLCPSVLRRHHIRRRKQSSFLAAVRIPVPAENAPKNEAKILVKLSFADKSHIYPVFTQPTKSKYSHRKSVIGYGCFFTILNFLFLFTFQN